MFTVEAYLMLFFICGLGFPAFMLLRKVSFPTPRSPSNTGAEHAR